MGYLYDEWRSVHIGEGNEIQHVNLGGRGGVPMHAHGWQAIEPPLVPAPAGVVMMPLSINP